MRAAIGPQVSLIPKNPMRNKVWKGVLADRRRSLRWIVAAVGLVIGAYSVWPTLQRPRSPFQDLDQEKPAGRSLDTSAPVAVPKPNPEIPVDDKPAGAVTGRSGRFQDVLSNRVIYDRDGRAIYRGDVDLSGTLKRIERGERLKHANDGATFQNRERRLPRQPLGYYREYVHPTPQVSGPGPQRIVTGEAGETYYTPDHYRTFIRIDRPAE
jgi:hypothetical protein